MQIRCASCGRAVTVAATGVLPGQCPHCQGAPVPARIGPFGITRLIAAGGMGEVYEAVHGELGSRIAIKLLPPVPGQDQAVLRQRFLREARLTAAVQHPGVVQVYDCGQDGDRLYLLLELVPGQTLRSRLKQGELPVAEAAAIAAAVADVLGAAHRQGLVHRDLKPDNVLLQPDGRVRVLDFGIAKALQEDEPLTRTGEILGTPEYMAPEQLLDATSEVDARTDVHALGLLLYELLTRRSPFQGGTLFQALKLVESLQPRPPGELRPGVPAALDAVVLQALHKERSGRQADGAAFAAAVRAAVGGAVAGIASSPPRQAHRRRKLAAALGLALLTAFVLGFLLPERTQVVAGSAARRAAAAAELEALLGRRTPDAARVQAAVRDLADANDAWVLHLRGRARLWLGQPLQALADLDRAHTGGAPGAGDDAAAAWHAVHTLLPEVAELPPWLGLVDQRRAARLCGQRAEGTPGPVRQAARHLLQGEAAAAVTLLAQTPPPRPTAARLLQTIATTLACADRRSARAAMTTVDGADRLAELLPGEATSTPAERLRALAASAEPGGPDRWLLELLAVFCACRDGDERAARLGAAAELAWLCGAGELAPVWYAGLRVHLAATAPLRHRLDQPEARRLLDLLAPVDPGEHPAVLPLRALLSLHTGGVDAAEQALVELPAEPPALAWFRAWRDAPEERRPAFRAGGWLLTGRPDPARVLVGRTSEAAPGASLMRALCATDPVAAMLACTAALAEGCDLAFLALLRPLPAPPFRIGGPATQHEGAVTAVTGAEVLRAALVDRLQAGQPPAELLPVLVVLGRAGLDLRALLAEPDLRPFAQPGLQDRLRREVFGGL